MLHLMKLAVGVGDIDSLRNLQRARIRHDPPLRHVTRMMPRRADDIVEGGSIYWVIGGVMQVRQRVIGITPQSGADGVQRTALLLDSELAVVVGRRVKAFQGWRYLKPADAPPDLGQAITAGGDVLPPILHQALADLCLV